MAKRPSSSLWFTPISSLIIPRGGDTLWYLIAILSIFSLFLHHLSHSSLVLADSHFEGFDVDEDEAIDDALRNDDLDSIQLTHNLRSTPLSTESDSETHHGPPDPTPTNLPSSEPSQPADFPPKPSSTGFDYWDEDEFEGLPVEETPTLTETASAVESNPDSEATMFFRWTVDDEGNEGNREEREEERGGRQTKIGIGVSLFQFGEKVLFNFQI